MTKIVAIVVAVVFITTINVYAIWREPPATPTEEYENPTAQFRTQRIVGLLIQDIQVKFSVHSQRGTDFVRDLLGDTRASIPAGMYRLIGDGQKPVTVHEAEDALKLITDFYIWNAMNTHSRREDYIKTINDTKKRPTKEMIAKFEAEVKRHVDHYNWFRYHYELLSSQRIMPEEVISLEEFLKEVEAGNIEVHAF